MPVTHRWSPEISKQHASAVNLDRPQMPLQAVLWGHRGEMAAFAGTTVLFAAASIWTRRTRHGGYERIRLAIMVNPPLGNVCLGSTHAARTILLTRKTAWLQRFREFVDTAGIGILKRWYGRQSGVNKFRHSYFVDVFFGLIPAVCWSLLT